MATGNITISDELRRKLEALAGPDKTADDLANDAVSIYIDRREQDRDWHDLVSFGRSSGARSGYTEAEVVDLVHQTRARR